jgi:hypothetical protein
VEGFFFIGLISIVVLAALPLVIAIALLVILALRHDDDVDSSRAPAIYASIVAFVSFLTVLFALAGTAASVGQYSVEDYGGGHHDATTGLVMSAIVAVIAVAILRLHLPVFDRRHVAVGAARRVYRAYALVLCLGVLVVGAIAAVAALFFVYSFIAPDVVGTDRGDALRSFAPAAVLLAGSGILWKWHWDELDLGGAAPPAATATDVP